MKYIKKPIPVDAWQISLDDKSPDWVNEAFNTNAVDVKLEPVRLVIKTLEGDMTAYPGDYLIKGPKGEYWFNKREIFEEMYEAVNDI